MASGTPGVDPVTGDFAGPDAYHPARTVIAVADLPKPGALMTMDLTTHISR